MEEMQTKQAGLYGETGHLTGLLLRIDVTKPLSFFTKVPKTIMTQSNGCKEGGGERNFSNVCQGR
jgi:hypothetical protein